MRIQKLSFSGIKNVLSRAELKKIMAGSGSCTPSCTNEGLAIPCCTCDPGCGVYLTFATPIPYECNCFCIAWGYSSGINDCPISGCGTVVSNAC
jgi:hypothetical protein